MCIVVVFAALSLSMYITTCILVRVLSLVCVCNVVNASVYRCVHVSLHVSVWQVRHCRQKSQQVQQVTP